MCLLLLGHNPRGHLDPSPGSLSPSIPPQKRTSNDYPAGARLFHFSDLWKGDKWVQNVVSKGLNWRWKLPPPCFQFMTQAFNLILSKYLDELLETHVVE